jgi:hypothetical protein
MPRDSQKLFAVIAIVIGIATALALAEVTLRIAGIGYGNAPLESHPVLHHVHPASYEYLAYSPAEEYGAYTITYDQHGFRTHKVPHLPRKGSPRYKVAFMGDSFVEATQVSDADSFVGRLLRTSNEDVDISNFGVSSYSPIYYVLQWRNFVKTWKPTHVFLLLFSNDVGGDEEAAREARFSPEGELLAIPGPGNDVLLRIARQSYLLRFLRMSQVRISWYFGNGTAAGQTDGQFFEQNPEMTERTARYLLQLASEVRAAGSELVLLAVPSKARLKFPHQSGPAPEFADVVRDWAQANGIEYLDLTRPFRAAVATGKPLYFDKDIHFNPEGHAIVANTIRAAYPRLFGSGHAQANGIQ